MKTARESQYDEEIEGKRRGHPPPTKPQTKAPVQSQLTTIVKHTEPAIRPTGDKPNVKHYKVDLKEHYKVDLKKVTVVHEEETVYTLEVSLRKEQESEQRHWLHHRLNHMRRECIWEASDLRVVWRSRRPPSQRPSAGHPIVVHKDTQQKKGF